MAMSGTGAMVMGSARHPFLPHLMSPLAVEQSCGLLSLGLGVIHRFDGLSTGLRWGRLLPHRKHRSAVIRTNSVMSDGRSRDCQQAQEQSSGCGETHLKLGWNTLSLMHQAPLDRIETYRPTNGAEE